MNEAEKNPKAHRSLRRGKLSQTGVPSAKPPAQPISVASFLASDYELATKAIGYDGPTVNGRWQHPLRWRCLTSWRILTSLNPFLRFAKFS
ncbi:hypothetical protein OUZ56_021179 [Daphnia magna]|uniref:Uncharacterized protein n=1 Tax=Daphnia magna TaxID=35525 RepID=A0ABQ9ZGQ3_9CRUS|nr:hypothetical protein OUZ56_021179 [Daphnia magna]